jgi:hypothetical protein
MEAIEHSKMNNLSIKSNSMPIFEKLFVWSLITEPLLLFNLPFTFLSPFSKVLNLVFLLLYTFNTHIYLIMGVEVYGLQVSIEHGQ